MKTNVERVLGFLIIIYIIEIILGGGGTILKYRGISFRMILFSIIMLITILHLINFKLNKIYFIYIFYFLVTTFFYTLTGMLSGADYKLVKIDMQKSLGFLMLIPFSILKLDEKFDRIIFRTTVVLGIAFLIMLLVLWTFDFNYIYILYSKIGDGEIFFRNGNGFLYKGFLYLNIGLIFSFYIKNKFKFFYSAFFLLLIYFTYTRGFYLSLVLVLVFYIILFANVEKKIRIYMSSILILPVLIILFKFVMLSFGDKTLSDSQRFLQIKEVLEMTNLKSFLWGHGYGIGTATRPISMEIAFLEIFHKQGTLGLMFYFSTILIPIYIYIFKLKEFKKKYEPYLLSSLFIFFQSMTNPFINNPIGMTFAVLVIVKGFYLKRMEE